MKHIAIIGAGAAGYFAAITAAQADPNARVSILEKSDKTLAKVKISGGGRCNVTHACFQISQLAKHYPRGEKQLKKAFGQFNTNHTVEWFESRGVKLKTEADNRMFPVTDSSQSIIDCLTKEADSLGVTVSLHTPVKRIEHANGKFNLHVGNENVIQADRVIVTTGGSPKLAGFDWLADLGHEIITPVPSLFTFNLPGDPIRDLMGVVANPATVRIQGTRLTSTGPLLVTHWGMSGPAVLRLSAFGARLLHEMNYHFTVQVNWLGERTEQQLRDDWSDLLREQGNKQTGGKNPFGLPNRLWDFLLNKVEIAATTRWSELGKKNTNRLLNTLLNDTYHAKGKTTFKEEFVTAGGISLADVDMSTMQSRKVPGLHFAGEVLNIDGVTGGFNFQAAWTTGWIAGRNAAL